MRLGPQRQRGQQQGARSGAKIENARGGLVGEAGARSLDQGFAVTAWDQHSGGDNQIEPVEVLVAEDIGDRLMLEAADHQRGDPGGDGIAHRVEQHPGAGDAQYLRHQQFGIEARGIGHGCEHFGGFADAERDGHLTLPNQLYRHPGEGWGPAACSPDARSVGPRPSPG